MMNRSWAIENPDLDLLAIFVIEILKMVCNVSPNFIGDIVRCYKNISTRANTGLFYPRKQTIVGIYTVNFS